MPRSLYCLLVAIDQYRAPVPPLHGCVNDIEAVQALLEEFAAAGEFELKLRVLKDSEATRSAVIEGFQGHLSKAGKDDVALFYYSGHGSQEDAPPEFWHVEPDRLNETLVCFDSREKGQWDLADKELAILIANVARQDPHILCVLDCCHSGSGTRADLEDGITVRRAPTDRRHRSIETFLDGALTLTSVGSASLRTGWGGTISGKHILMAACRSSETAKETREDGKTHGAFTAALLSALRQTKGSITYRDLLKRAEALVRLRVAQQVPQIEASDPDDLHRLFLGGAARLQRSRLTLRFDNTLGWVIDGGAIHGIAAPANGETTMLAVYDLEPALESSLQFDKAIATAEVIQVRPELSQVRVSVKQDALLEATTYRAVVVSTPLPSFRVYLKGEAVALKSIREALATAGGNRPSTLVREVVNEDQADVRLEAVAGSFRVSKAASNRPLISEIVGTGKVGANAAVLRLEHIARWEAIARLENPLSRLGNAAVEIITYRAVKNNGTLEWHETDSRRAIRLEYSNIDGKWHQPSVRIELKNTGDDDVYCALLWLGEDYSVSSELIREGALHLPKDRAVILNNGDPIWASVPDEKWHQGQTEVNDLLKLIVSTEQFDPTLLEQSDLDRHTITRTASRHPGNPFDRLSARVRDRALSTKPAVGELLPEWTASSLVVSVVRPLEATPIPRPGSKQALGAGVTLLGHSSLEAAARLISPTEAGRGLGDLGVPAIFRDEPQSSQPFLFEKPRGSDSGLGAVQLVDVKNPEVVNAKEPLILRVATELQPHEHVLPFAWDGEFFLPLGVCRSVDGEMEVQLQRLPAPLQTASDVERGIVSSIRILFQKLISDKLGTDFQYPRLAAVSFDDGGSPIYNADRGTIGDAVARANRILLYVHGILGDTRGMAASSRTEIHVESLPPQRIGEDYDLVLAFDYENINTGIALTARKLGEQLTAIGLGSDHEKTLHVAAHSMGGLVARWFIEIEGGNRVVQHLVTLGTPHAGSPWPTIQDWATAAIAFGLNGLTRIAWPVKILADLLGAVETVDVMLDEMAPNSTLLVDLAKSGDPGIPYTLLVGNTSMIEAIAESGRLEKLLAKVSPQKLLHGVTSLAFMRAPNDIAVSVISAKAVPSPRKREPQIIEVACDHLTFFSSAAGLKALRGALK
jgi:pimeloyl-ACP methyl ester carboxylesterase